ncbi:type VI secretion system Vgr family protein [Flavobacterium sp. FlaQc-48]|uniref:type VI secretion system Vgr family protein n=1 Tax=Flavobacterium sp. FlaQc-48 TaxID=3374181 RepID=UPI003756FB14
MALNTDTTIKIGDIIIRNFSHLKINQKIHDHHTFSIEVRQDILAGESESVMPITQNLSAAKVSIEIKAIADLDDLMVVTNPKDYIMQFSGIVTRVSMRKSRVRNMEETILITGYGSSIVLDNGKESNSFTDKPLADIVNQVKASYDIDMKVTPHYKENLPYTVQYNESDFAFLNRIAMRYGQWFYYNGTSMVFGTPGGIGGEPKLVYGVNMQEFSYDVKLSPTLFKAIENDNLKGNYYAESTSKYKKEVNGFHQNFINKSNQVFNKETVIQSNQNAVGGSGKKSSEEYAKNKMRSIMGDMIQIEASSEVPGVTIGSNVSISGVDPQLESSYRVIQITHTCDDGGGYENHFKAVNLNGAVFSPKTNPDLVPRCESQTAIVIANDDPDGLGDLKIQMPWQEAKGETTPFVPIAHSHGGSDKGIYIIPEVGEKVFVDFQGGNAEMPIVMGAMFNRNAKSGYATPNNDMKVICTRSGIKIVYNDADGSLLIEDPSGNRYFMDGKGNTFVKVPKNMTFDIGEDLTFNVGKNMITHVGEDQNTHVGKDKSTTVNNKNSLQAQEYKQNIDENKTVEIGGDLNETTSTTTHKAIGGDILIHSIGISKLLGAKDAKVNKG